MKKVTIITLILIGAAFGSQAFASIDPGTISRMVINYQDLSKIQSINLPDEPISNIPGEKYSDPNIITGNNGNPDDINWLNNNRSGGLNVDFRIGEDLNNGEGPDNPAPGQSPPSIPEPITLVLVGLGLAGIGIVRKLK